MGVSRSLRQGLAKGGAVGFGGEDRHRGVYKEALAEPGDQPSIGDEGPGVSIEGEAGMGPRYCGAEPLLGTYFHLNR